MYCRKVKEQDLVLAQFSYMIGFQEKIDPSNRHRLPEVEVKQSNRDWLANSLQISLGVDEY